MHEKYEVKITRVIDGDTVVGDVAFHVMGNEFILRDQHFRLEGIDAPELNDKWDEGEMSRDYLKQMIEGRTVEVDVHDKDKYGRWLAVIWYDGINVNEMLVKEGMADERIY
jgi:micrococcal nuclease